jgi:hypothetical protein
MATKEFMSTADAAKFLFLSRLHLARLIDQGVLKIHHKIRHNSFVTMASVLAYQATLRAAITEYNAATGDEE